MRNNARSIDRNGEGMTRNDLTIDKFYYFRYPTYEDVDSSYPDKFNEFNDLYVSALKRLAIVLENSSGDNDHFDFVPNTYSVVTSCSAIFLNDPDATLYINDSTLQHVIETGSKDEIFPLVRFVQRNRKLRIITCDIQDPDVDFVDFPRDLFIEDVDFNKMTLNDYDILI